VELLVFYGLVAYRPILGRSDVHYEDLAFHQTLSYMDRKLGRLGMLNVKVVNQLILYQMRAFHRALIFPLNCYNLGFHPQTQGQNLFKL